MSVQILSCPRHKFQSIKATAQNKAVERAGGKAYEDGGWAVWALKSRERNCADAEGMRRARVERRGC